MDKKKQGVFSQILKGAGAGAEEAEYDRQAVERRENDPEYKKALAYDNFHGGNKAMIKFLKEYRLMLAKEKEAHLARIKEMEEANRILLARKNS